MMTKLRLPLIILLTVICLAMPLTAVAQSAGEPVVQAVLFYSPSCPHCHFVIKEVLVPMVDEYGDQLQIIGIDTTQPEGGQLYQATIEQYQIPSERRGVPTLIIGQTILVGSVEIPEQFPALVDENLAAGGIGWPHIPGFVPPPPVEAESESPSSSESEPPTDSASDQPEPQPETATSTESETQPEAATSTESEAEPSTAPAADQPETQAVVPASTKSEAQPPTAPAVEAPDTPSESAPAPPSSPPTHRASEGGTFAPQATESPQTTADQAVLAIGEEPLPASEEMSTPPPDPVGMTLAGIVLVGMVAVLGYTTWQMTTGQHHLFQLSQNPANLVKAWAIPILSLLGLGVALYLAYVEINQVEAVCGPVGECNIVQASPYARIIGIPIAVLGVLNYLAIGLLWFGQRYVVGGPLANLSVLGLLGLTFAGTLFSIYLTWLEIFAIHAVCAWCISSAVITTISLLLVVLSVTHKRTLRV